MKPGSQGVFNPKNRAFCTRTRKVAWKCVLGSVGVLQEIPAYPAGPSGRASVSDECQAESVLRLASRSSVVNPLQHWWSARSPITPTLKRVRICRTIALFGLMAT